MLTDADIEARELAALGDYAAGLYARGVCAHMGWQTFVSADATPHLAVGEAICLDCGRRFPSEAALLAETDDLLN